jgi:hypothetical protein
MCGLAHCAQSFCFQRAIRFGRWLPRGGGESYKMLGTLRVVIDASYAFALMAFVGIVAGFATAAITSDTHRGLQVAVGMFAATGALLTLRLWRTTRGTELPPAGPAV